MNAQNVLYCKTCKIVEVDAYNLLCDGLGGCNQKKIDLGSITTIEEALWIGMDITGSSMRTSLNWELAGSPLPKKISFNESVQREW